MQHLQKDKYQDTSKILKIIQTRQTKQSKLKKQIDLVDLKTKFYYFQYLISNIYLFDDMYVIINLNMSLYSTPLTAPFNNDPVFTE